MVTISKRKNNSGIRSTTVASGLRKGAHDVQHASVRLRGCQKGRMSQTQDALIPARLRAVSGDIPEEQNGAMRAPH